LSLATPRSSALVGIFDARGDFEHGNVPAFGRDLLAASGWHAVADGAIFVGRHSPEERIVSRAGHVGCLLEGTV
jgi:hypothetical protein